MLNCMDETDHCILFSYGELQQGDIADRKRYKLAEGEDWEAVLKKDTAFLES